jgi:hypothetical protein
MWKRWQKLTAPQRIATMTTVAAVAVWSAVLVVPDVHEAEHEVAPAAPSEQAPAPDPAHAPEQETVPQAPAAPQPSPAAPKAPVAAAPQAQPAPSGSLRDSLASDNAGTRIAALRALAAAPVDEALPALLALDVTRDPETAPTVIRVTAQLAQRADASQRTAAATQLSRWLSTEQTRTTPDARGNVSILVETLGDLGSPEAESALVAVLQNEQLPLHVQTLAVDGLARLGTPAAQAALTQFRAQLSSTERSGFELELQREAETATDRALARLSR